MKLGDWADARGLSDTALGKLLGVSQPTANRLRNGKRRPGWAVLQRILVLTDSEVREEDFFDAPEPPEAEDTPTPPAKASAA